MPQQYQSKIDIVLSISNVRFFALQGCLRFLTFLLWGKLSLPSSACLGSWRLGCVRWPRVFLGGGYVLLLFIRNRNRVKFCCFGCVVVFAGCCRALQRFLLGFTLFSFTFSSAFVGLVLLFLQLLVSILSFLVIPSPSNLVPHWLPDESLHLAGCAAQRPRKVRI